MQVTAPASFPTLSATTKTQELTVTASKFQVDTSTMDAVSINRPREEPASYHFVSEYVSGLREPKPQGAGATALSRNLLTTLDYMQTGKSTFRVSSIFNQIAALSGETVEYRNEARRMQVTHEAKVKNPMPDFKIQPTSENKSVALSVKTKEGDTIQIMIKQRDIGVGNSTLEFSFTVDGSLSKEEQKALGELAEKLGQMGDEFFRSETTELRNLKGIDTSVISHFSFTMKQPGPKDTYLEHSYEFSLDENAQTQTLRATDIRGYSVDITTSLNTLTEGSTADASMLLPYLELLREATDDAKVVNKSRRFMLDAFESMFGEFINATPIASSDITSPKEAAQTTLAAFDTGLPDFTASIRSRVIHNREFYSQTSVLMLNMSQETRIEQSADDVLIKQESRYELTNNRFEGIFDLENPDISNPIYKYITEHREGNLSRVLSMTAEKVNNLLIEQNVSQEKEVRSYRNYKLVDVETDSYSDRKLQQYSDLLLKLNNNKQFLAIDELLAASRPTAFLMPV
ncbi:MAG TPA: hypothetical protein VL995_03255 [Cellvibrio sp.]|nr:hypothetical protein [Cellvibrio sp.]